MSLKKITSLFLILSFLIVLFSTIVLYIAPPGSFASWSGWRFLFIGKSLWRDLHITIGFLFLFFLLIHIFYNYKLIIRYFKKTGSFFLSKEMLVAVLIFLFSFIGTAFKVQPFKGILSFGNYAKRFFIKSMPRPPYRHAEYSTLNVFCMRTGIDINFAISKLKSRGLKSIDSDKTFVDIATSNHLSPNELYKAIIE